jgi:hypothetical protein
MPKVHQYKRYSLWVKFKRILRYMYLRLVRQQTPIHNVAIGFATGVFVGFLPIIPTQTIVAIAVAWLLRGSKIAAALGTWIANPLYIIPFYLMLYYVGSLVILWEPPPFNPDFLTFRAILKQGWGLFLTMLAGGVTLSIPFSILSYFLARLAISSYRARKQAWKNNQRARS